LTVAALTARVTGAALDWIGEAGGDVQAPRNVNTVKPAACQRTSSSYHDGYRVMPNASVRLGAP
jgi:hypothetical protein